MVEPYIPDRGDIMWINLDPQLGHEQAGRRPALVISLLEYNKATKLCLAMPITSQAKGFPSEELIISDKTSGVILTDQLKNHDWSQRDIKYIETISERKVQQALERLNMIINIKSDQ